MRTVLSVLHVQSPVTALGSSLAAIHSIRPSNFRTPVANPRRIVNIHFCLFDWLFLKTGSVCVEVALLELSLYLPTTNSKVLRLKTCATMVGLQAYIKYVSNNILRIKISISLYYICHIL